MNHRDALEAIMKICGESSEQSRRIQKVHDLSMTALGLTHNQRAERHEKALQRAEQFRATRITKGKSVAKIELVDAVKEDTGEVRVSIRKQVAESYVC